MSGATISCASGGGFAGALDTQTIVNGQTGTAGGANRVIGRDAGLAIGSINSGNSAIYGGAAITFMEWNEANGTYGLQITGTLSNTGWTNIVINTATPTTFVRASATFTQIGGSTQWAWTTASNPVGPNGSTYAVGFN